MKVLIVSISDLRGGAARAAYRLHKSLLSENVDTTMLVQVKDSDDYTVLGPISKIQRGIGEIRPTLDLLANKFYKNKSQTYFSASWLPFSDIVEQINDINADIVHLHWICSGMMRIEDIARIKAPIVWSLHDMWPFTGGCHYSEECKNYEETCGYCKVLGSQKENDLSRKIFNRKQKTLLKKDNLTIVGLSRWLSTCASSSTLLKDRKHVVLPNPIDTTTYKPFDKQKARELWKLPRDKKLVLFGALGATSDPRKGFKELTEAMKKLTSKDIEFVIFGSGEPKKALGFNFKTHYVGHLADDISLITLYSAVDIMVVPSLQEAFGQTASESMSCGIPVVAFATTGLLDIVDHKKNGYLAKPFESQDLAKGIEWVLDASNYDRLCANAREKVLQNFDSVVVAKQYIKLYDSILSTNTRSI